MPDVMLELNDIQGLMLSRLMLPYGRYTFLTVHDSRQGQALLAHLMDQIRTAAPESTPPASSLSVAVTCDGLRALGIAEVDLATFPEEFRLGMPARAALLGDHDASHPDHWEGGLAGSELHLLLVLFASDAGERDRQLCEQERLLAACSGITVISTQDAAVLSTRREHFGYKDFLTTTWVQGIGGEPPPGSGPASMPGEFVLGYPDETGNVEPLPRPDALSRNGTFLVYRRLYEDVAAFRAYLQAQAATRDEQELLAAKLMGRWRSGAPLVLAPEHDDAELATDPQRNNAFDYGQMDPQGLACPIGAHIRRVNPRDTITNIRRRRLIRGGLPYGPLLPEGAADDGQDRGVTQFFACASISRQFEFIQKKWINDPTFQGLEHDKDPLAGDHDGTYNMTIQRRPLKKVLRGLPRFTVVKGGGYFFLPGIQALRFLANSAHSM
jgi:Dyp-type peroxidase family